MKIYTITAVLCMATTVLATQRSSNSIEQGQKLVRRAADPRDVQSQEYRLHRHSEHGLEAHKDGNGHDSEHDDDDEEEGDDKESKNEGNKGKSDGDDGEKTDNKGKNEGKKDDGDKKAGAGKEGEDKKNQNGGQGKKPDEGKHGEGAKGEDKKNGGGGKNADGKAPNGTGPGTGTGADANQGGHQGAAPANGKAPVAGTPASPANGKPPVGGTPAKPATDSNIPHDYASPLWLVQPFGASVWAQGTAYVISWGPNPDPIYSKKLTDKTLLDIRLMQGPPDQLKEVAVLMKDVDSSLNSFTWTVPVTVAPAKDYSIRLINEGQVDTYSHYFEIVAAGDPRSSESNVGEPLEMPQMGDVPMPLNKDLKPSTPPNPPPATKPAAAAPPPAAKPAAHVSAAVVGLQSANMLAFAMTLFGAVYLL